MTCLLYTVNLEISVRILFSGIALKDIFATFKKHEKGMIYLSVRTFFRQ